MTTFLFILSLPAYAIDCDSSSVPWLDDMSEALAFAPINLKSSFDAMLNGEFEEAKNIAHLTANNARFRDNERVVENAGKAWQIADLLGRAKTALEDGNYEQAKALAKEAADLVRELRDSGGLRGPLAEDILDQAGALWNEANDLAKTNPSGGTINVAPIDQHALSHGSGGVFCGVVTALMAAQSNGSDLNTSYSDISYIASKMYYSGRGTSGSDMATFLRQNGMPNASFTTGGSFSDINSALKNGQPVPMGVDYSRGTVHSMPNGSSARYGNLSPGSYHSKSFVNPGQGHWVLITGTEGDPNNPSAYLVNDPDMGGTLRVTPEQLSYMSGESNGGFWLVRP